ncbi:hypothetical protein [Methylomonas methanica]|uniref:PEP-CTERM sorting domain-containing protein n=1 Tax=Methylomonas methanica (strain DSM 25384 / MC09) TaxID=857087 RepID=G0A239_METMM|nr:hypothetical protein [Methylomonas methanica]AEG02582.1 hypothetical protein Metme_4231 [Methylomonas methanica MC09]
MEKKKYLIPIALVAMGFTVSAEATLLGVTQASQYPYVNFENAYLIYDHNGVDNSTGLLTIASFDSRLHSPSGANVSQSYMGGSDSTPDAMLTIAINKSNGSWNSISAAGVNQVTINFGNSVSRNNPNTNTPGFSWTGDITGFGWLEDNSFTSQYEFGTKFDATWQMTGDAYEDMPSNMSSFIDDYLTSLMSGYQGGIVINNTAGFIDPDNAVTNGANQNPGEVSNPKAWQRDWVFGAGAATDSNLLAALNPLLGGLATTSCRKFDSTNCVSYIDSNVYANVFVPIPPALLLWGGALASLFPFVRRIKNNVAANALTNTV